ENGFLHTEIPDREINMTICSMAYRRHIAGSVPGSFYIEKFAQARHFHSRRDAANLRNMATDIIHIMIGNGAHKFIGIIKEFAHRKRNSGACPELFEP